MSEANIIDEIYDTSDLSLENSDINEDSEEIENLIYNLSEKDIMGLYKNYSYKMDDNVFIDNTISNSKPDNITEKYLKNKEQISEVKYNIFMRIWNSCKPKDDVYKAIIRNSDKTFHLRRLIAQDFNIINNKDERKLCFKEKKYSFIPIDEDSTINCKFHIDGDSLNIEFSNKLIKNLKINGKKIEGMSENDFEKKYNIEIPRKEIKSLTQRSEKHQCISQVSKVLSDKNRLTDPLNNIQYNTSRIPSNESYREEFSGSSLYVNLGNENSNNFTRFFFLSDYTKEINGIYPIHNDINLNIGKVEFPDLSKEIKEYNSDNDLKGQIFYKNFDSQKIMANEPIILEIKSSFSLYDIMNQIKQNIKILSNTSKNLVNIVLPKYIIGILCDYNFKSAEREKNKLNFLYFNDNNDTKKTELEHILDIIDKNKINVVICFVKKEIEGYSLTQEDYNIPGEKLKYRVELKYMYKKIFNKEINEELLKNFQEEIEYHSIRFEKKFNLNFNYEEYSKLSSYGENPENIKKKIITLKEDYETLKKNYEEENKRKLILQKNYEEEKKQSKQKIEELKKEILELKKQMNQKGQIQHEKNQKEKNMNDKNLSEKITQNQNEQEQNQQIKNKQKQESLFQSDNS